MNSKHKTELVNELLPFLNQLAQAEKSQIVASAKQEITFADLIALDEAELKKLETLMKSVKAAKFRDPNKKSYDKHFQLTSTSEPNEKKYKIH